MKSDSLKGVEVFGDLNREEFKLSRRGVQAVLYRDIFIVRDPSYFLVDLWICQSAAALLCLNAWNLSLGAAGHTSEHCVPLLLCPFRCFYVYYTPSLTRSEAKTTDFDCIMGCGRNRVLILFLYTAIFYIAA